MEECYKHFKSLKSCSIHVLPNEIKKIDSLCKLIKNLNLTTFCIDGNKVDSKESLLKYLAESMKFPDYFGENWDAFEECVNDLSWWSTQGFIIIFKNSDGFINCSIEDFMIFIDVLIHASKSWFSENIPFHIIIMSNQWRSIPDLCKFDDTICFHNA